jgi:hypothetical protein
MNWCDLFVFLMDAMTFVRTAFSRITLNGITLSRTALIRMTLSKPTLSIVKMTVRKAMSYDSIESN